MRSVLIDKFLGFYVEYTISIWLVLMTYRSRSRSRDRSCILTRPTFRMMMTTVMFNLVSLDTIHDKINRSLSFMPMLQHVVRISPVRSSRSDLRESCIHDPVNQMAGWRVGGLEILHSR